MLREIDKIKEFALVILSSILLALSFPNYNLEPLAYVAFIPLFFALRRTSPKEAFLLSYICGLLFFGITIFWLRHVSILGYILLVAILSVFFAIFSIFFLSAIRRPLSALFAIPAFWVILEYIRSNLFTGFPWALLGYSQYLNLPVIQIADLAGAYGVSFFVMMINVAIYALLSNGIKKCRFLCIASIITVFMVLGYGYFTLNSADRTDEYLNISLIQGNIPQSMKWDPQYKEYIIDIYAQLTKEAGREGPDLIIWPETALPGFIEERGLLNRVKDLAKDTKTDLLIGAPSYRPDREELFNTALLISKEGYVAKRYDKLHLVPFGEYIPLGKYLRFIRRFINKPIGDFAKGSEYTIFELKDKARFGALICFEDIFANLVRNFVARDVNLMVNITNDAWFMKTGAPYQHAQSSVFRAVENRVPVVRAANTGLSCFIDRDGRIIDTVKADKEEIFIAGFKTKKVALSSGGSFYTRFGDLFIFLCIAMFLVRGAIICKRKYA